MSVNRTNNIAFIITVHCVQKKKHPFTFTFISPIVIGGFKQKLQ